MTTDATAAYQAEMMRGHYGVYAEAHGGNVVMSTSEYERLRQLVLSDPLLDPIGRGFYLGNGNIVVVPDWTFDPLKIATARLIAVLRMELLSMFRRVRIWPEHGTREA